MLAPLAVLRELNVNGYNLVASQVKAGAGELEEPGFAFER